MSLSAAPAITSPRTGPTSWPTRLLAIVVPHRYSIGAQTFGVGIGLTAYTLGARHAFDADHISAIDNTTRKLMADGKRPLSTGFCFSLGHSSVVFVLYRPAAITDPLPKAAE